MSYFVIQEFKSFGKDVTTEYKVTSQSSEEGARVLAENFTKNTNPKLDTVFVVKVVASCKTTNDVEWENGG